MTAVILASQSPRRSQLLQQANIPFTVMVQPVEENWPDGMPVNEIPTHIARNKALAVKATLKEDHSPIIAADTVVVLNNEIIGKPKDRTDAINILLRLSGQTHTVITGVIVLHNGKETAFSEATEVEFYEISAEDAGFYVDTYQPYDKAGAYAIQEWIGITAIRAIRGDFYNVMGLPVSRLCKVLKSI